MLWAWVPVGATSSCCPEWGMTDSPFGAGRKVSPQGQVTPHTQSPLLLEKMDFHPG